MLDKLIIVDESHELYNEIPWNDFDPLKWIKVDSKTIVKKLGKPEQLPGTKLGQNFYEWKIQWGTIEDDTFFRITSTIDQNGNAYPFSKGKWAFYDLSGVYDKAKVKSFFLYLKDNEDDSDNDDSDNDEDSDNEDSDDNDVVDENGEVLEISKLISLKRFDKNKKYSKLNDYVNKMYPNIDPFEYFDEGDLPGSMIEHMYNNTYIEDEKNGKRLKNLVRYIDTIDSDEINEIYESKDYIKYYLRLVME